MNKRVYDNVETINNLIDLQLQELGMNTTLFARDLPAQIKINILNYLRDVKTHISLYENLIIEGKIK